MTLQWILASLHLLALGIGLGAVLARGFALRRDLTTGNVGTIFLADTFWGIAAVLWIATGLIRAFGGVEKGSDYYLHSGAFAFKMTLLVVILILEIRPMATLIRWRIRQARGETFDTSVAAAMAGTSFIQAALVVLMVFAATAMARGFGAQFW